MNEDVFPFLQAAKYTEDNTVELPLYIDVLWDEINNCAVLNNAGEPVLAEGNAALRGWILRTLKTERYAERFFTRSHGSELKRLIGKEWRRETRMAEAKRYICDSLLHNHYITSVDVYSVEFYDGTISIKCNVKTVYGEFEINV